MCLNITVKDSNPKLFYYSYLAICASPDARGYKLTFVNMHRITKQLTSAMETMHNKMQKKDVFFLFFF